MAFSCRINPALICFSQLISIIYTAILTWRSEKT